MQNDPTLDEVDKALEALDADMTAIECHGTLVGLLCAREELPADEWIQRAMPGLKADSGDLLAKDAIKVLAGLYETSKRQLTDPVLDFHPLLPGEEAPLEERIEALGEWCQGFLMGLTIGEVNDLKALPADSAEVVHDLAELGSITSYELAGEEEDELAYAELLEYVRTGVLLINEELNPRKAPPRDSDITYH